MELLHSIIAGIVSVLTLIAALAPFILPLLGKIKDDRIRGFAEDAVAFAEQIAKGDTEMKGTKKYDLAAAKLIESAKVAGIKVKPEAVSALLEAALGKHSLRK
jgi:hypothetical protein